ncbi:MAG: ThiF family adenylyltransferase [Gallionella sp.]|nr:ThiF family adenylyltransferase [Gallionella sp.]
MSDERLGNVFRLLSSKGFVATGTRAGRRSFKGPLQCSKGTVHVQIVISDWDFLTYPAITLLNRPSFLPALMPHVDVNGGLCYFKPGAVVLDRYDPAIAIAQCLQQAEAVLNRIATDPDYRSGDIQDEFLAHWEFGQTTLPWPVLIGSILPNAVYANYSWFNTGSGRRAVIASGVAEVAAFAKAFSDTEPSQTTCKCWLFKTELRPAVPEIMPTTIKELFAWLQQWDRKVYNGIQRVLEQDASYLSYSFATFAIDTPVGWLGFGFDLDQIKRLGAKRRPKLYKQYLHGKGGSSSILRLSITDISPSFVHSRNLSFADLRDKRITVIGCGAIGSYLAQSLVRLGAGLGRGSLRLVDHDTLQPENLGRHALGYPALFKFKAHALREELLRQFPLSQIEAVAKSVVDYQPLFDADLLIDATGEESVSELLNGWRLDRKAKTPILHVWIKGNGECVQSLWADNSGTGCFRCLKSTDEYSYRQDRFPVLNVAPLKQSVGCHAFTPYAVSSPMQAAALAIDAVIDWMKGDPSPRFRTRSIENSDVRRVKNQNISRLQNCPACGQR